MTDKQLAIGITAVTAFVYYVGWAYLYNYYGFFDIDIFEIGPSVQNTLIFSFPALLNLLAPKGELYVFASVLLILAVLAFVLTHLAKSAVIKSRVGTWPADKASFITVLTFIVLMLIEGYASAKGLARQRAVEKWMNDSNPAFVDFVPPPQTVQAAPTSAVSRPGFAGRLETLNANLQLRFVTSTSQFYYLFARDDCDEKVSEACAGFLFRVRAADVKTITILHSGAKRQ